VDSEAIRLDSEATRGGEEVPRATFDARQLASSEDPPSPAGPHMFVKETPMGTLTYGFQPKGARPDSASGCNQDVCISIVGSSNHVDEWDSVGFVDNAICTWSDFTINSGLVLSTNVICGDGAGAFVAYWHANRYFPSPSLACNTWFAIPGKPCETIRR
jgi:hypothetical protein